MMKALTFKYKEHAAEVAQWLTKHSFPLPPEHLLPTTGFIVEGIACGFLYCTNSSFGLLEWVFSNPKRSKEERTQAIDLIFKLVEETSSNLGITALFSAASIPAYAKILERNGFNETDKNVSHYIKTLGGN
jgi:hypothetical protein